VDGGVRGAPAMGGRREDRNIGWQAKRVASASAAFSHSMSLGPAMQRRKASVLGQAGLLHIRRMRHLHRGRGLLEER
jgi:hypothetical protein